MDSIQPKSWQMLAFIAIAAVGVGLSGILALHFSDMEIRARRAELTVEATTFTDDLEQYLQSREEIAKTVGAIFKAPDLSDTHPLESVGKRVLALTPGIRVMAWVPQVDPSRNHELVDALSAAGRPLQLYGPNFETADITDTRRILYPVMDVEASSNGHQIGLGMDVNLFASRKVAFEQARDGHRVIATAPEGLLSPSDTPGYVLFSPVYNERGFVGCIMFVFPVDKLMAGFADGRSIPMNFHVYDATDSGRLEYVVGLTPQRAIETVDSSIQSADAEALQQFMYFAGRKMLVRFDPESRLSQAGIQQALTVGFLGLVLTGMVLWGMNYFIRSSLRLNQEIATTNSAKVSLELVNRELGHRVGNLLAVAQALVWLTYEASQSTAELRDSVIDRLHSLHQSVGLINREDWKGVWLHELAKVEFAPVADRINVIGRDVLLKSRAAQSLSLLFYELMTNASKYGALSKREGTVTVEWEIKESESGRLFFFRWQEHGHAIVEPPVRQGFGTKLLTRLVPSDLSGRASLNFEPDGLRYELQASVERVVEEEGIMAMKAKAVVASAKPATIL